MFIETIDVTCVEAPEERYVHSKNKWMPRPSAIYHVVMPLLWRLPTFFLIPAYTHSAPNEAGAVSMEQIRTNRLLEEPNVCRTINRDHFEAPKERHA